MKNCNKYIMSYNLRVCADFISIARSIIEQNLAFLVSLVRNCLYSISALDFN